MQNCSGCRYAEMDENLGLEVVGCEFLDSRRAHDGGSEYRELADWIIGEVWDRDIGDECPLRKET